VGAIKDVIDLLTQLANKVQDRKLSAEISSIQKLTLELQSEHAELHEANIELREERLGLRERIQALEAQIAELSSASSSVPSEVPNCPNCSTKSRPFYMRPLGPDFVRIHDATHECPQCKFRMKVRT
jgi:peptidoglycan hydrolase CwlO-like protein